MKKFDWAMLIAALFLGAIWIYLVFGPNPEPNEAPRQAMTVNLSSNQQIWGLRPAEFQYSEIWDSQVVLDTELNQNPNPTVFDEDSTNSPFAAVMGVLDQSEIFLDENDNLNLVTRVVDGDTIDIEGVGRVRLIGLDTPETVDPRKPVQCFGKEASKQAKGMLLGQKVFLKSDPTQGDRDKYGRALRYVFLEDGIFFNQWMIANGFAHEYTYNIPYKYMAEFKQAEQEAREANRGLWSPDACRGDTSSASLSDSPSQPSSDECSIKGNISAVGEKIYHLPGGAYYEVTKIDEVRGERWFCLEDEAQAAGWRKSLK